MKFPVCIVMIYLVVSMEYTNQNMYATAQKTSHTSGKTSEKMKTESVLATVAPAQQPNQKRRRTDQPKKSKRIQMICDFNVNGSDVAFHALVKSAKCNLVPMKLCDEKESPILVQMSGGGKIPAAFGIQEKEDDSNKVNVTLQVASRDDHKQLERLHGEVVAVMCKNWAKWNSGSKQPSKEVIQEFCYHLVQPRKPKKNSPDEFWDGTTKSSFTKTDLVAGKCRIVDSDSGEPVDIKDVPGRKWHKAIFEFRHVYILGTKSFGITKTLRYLSTSDEDSGDIIPL
jgi:hypothetical protein